MPLSVFQQKKQRILASLSQPEQDYSDLSPKGSVDAGIRELLHKINNCPGLVTTSSCAGRVSVFLEGQKKRTNKQDNVESSAQESGPTGKGGGKWLFVSHDPVVIQEDNNRKTSLISMLGMQEPSAAEGRIPDQSRSLVHFKFEPMILHILASSLEEASRVLNAASQAGFRESGAVSIMPAKDGSTTPMVAVRSAGLSFDSIVGYQAENGSIVSVVDEGYLAILFRLSNERFATNTERISRFQSQLLQLQQNQS